MNRVVAMTRAADIERPIRYSLTTHTRETASLADDIDKTSQAPDTPDTPDEKDVDVDIAAQLIVVNVDTEDTESTAKNIDRVAQVPDVRQRKNKQDVASARPRPSRCFKTKQAGQDDFGPPTLHLRCSASYPS